MRDVSIMDGGIAAADAADAGDDEPAKPPAPPPCACCGQPSKYRCPACDARTCSLLCVNKHKADKPCSGVRNTADYRPIQAFDDAALMHDYRFLEDAIRIVDSSKRRQRDVEAPPAATRRGGQTPARDNLVKQAHERGIRLELMPHGMQKQRDNTTRYDGRRRQLIWRVELRFAAAGVLHILPSVPEGCTLLRLLRSILEPNVALSGNEGGGDAAAASCSTSTCDANGSTKVALPVGISAKESAETNAAGGGGGGSSGSGGGGGGGRPGGAGSAGGDTNGGSKRTSGGGEGGNGGGGGGQRKDEGQRALLRHKLRAYGKEGAANLRVLLFAEGRRADDPRYYALPLDMSLSAALRGKSVIEFPTLHIELPHGHAPEGGSSALEDPAIKTFPLMPEEDERVCAPDAGVSGAPLPAAASNDAECAQAISVGDSVGAQAQ